MFEKLREKLKRVRLEPVAYDPSPLGDEVAARTAWTPAKSGGASFNTHLLTLGPARAEFRATKGAWAFYLAFFVTGVVTLIGSSVAIVLGFRSDLDAWFMIFLPFLVGGVFTVAGGFMLYHGAAPIVFDKQRGEYWKGRASPADAGAHRAVKQHARLDRIHALQMVAELCTSDDSSYYSYELNLVLKDATRLNVIDHGRLDELRRDADALARFLDKPLWDATS